MQIQSDFMVSVHGIVCNGLTEGKCAAVCLIDGTLNDSELNLLTLYCCGFSLTVINDCFLTLTRSCRTLYLCSASAVFGLKFINTSPRLLTIVNNADGY